MLQTLLVPILALPDQVSMLIASTIHNNNNNNNNNNNSNLITTNIMAAIRIEVHACHAILEATRR